MYTVFIALQYEMHAEHDIVLPILSVCPTNPGVVSKRMDISSQFLTLVSF